MPGGALPAALGRYKPVALIGAGSSGTVYRAHDPLIGRDVAVKVIRLDGLNHVEMADYGERFRAEAQAGGRCQHPAIAAIFDAGEVLGQPFLVMEYVEGRSLDTFIADPAACQMLDAVAVMTQILGALDYAHAQGVVHRNLKPANVMIAAAQRVKVMDFGIARLASGNAMGRSIYRAPHYIAPEQASGGPVDQRTDLFCAAAIFFGLLTGRPPFTGVSVPEALARLQDDAPVDLSELPLPHLCFAPVLRRGLAKARDRRFADAREFAVALREAAHELADAQDVATALDEVVHRILSGDAPGPTPAPAPDSVPPSAASPFPEVGPMPAPAPVPEPAPLPEPEPAKPALGFPPKVLEAIAVQLALHVGPIARLQVSKAARAAANADEFFTLLADSLPSPQVAAEFLRAAHQAVATAPAPPPAPPAAPVPGGAVAQALSAETTEALRATLAMYIGPIAKLLLTKALADSPAPDTLVERLVQAAPSPDDAVALRRRLQAVLAGQKA